LFTGANNVEIMNSITRKIGMPRPSDFDGFPHRLEYQPIGSRASVLRDALPETAPDSFIDLLQKAFAYAPETRVTAADQLMHRFFADVVDGTVSLPNGRKLPSYLKKVGTPKRMLTNFLDGP
jgi:serine/threonine protein kinase